MRFFVLLFLLSVSRGSTPKDAPCETESPGIPSLPRVFCTGLNTDRELILALTPYRGQKIYELVIKNSYLNYVPSETFKDIRVQILVLREMSLRSLSETDIALVGLEDSLEGLTLMGCTFMSDWDWQKLRNLKRLKTLRITTTDIQEMDAAPDFAKDIREFSLYGSQIERLDDNAFASMEALEKLYVNQNGITYMKRSMLPNPANKLFAIDLSENDIDKLPDDLFTNMPQLKWLYLQKNNILFLDEKTFRTIMPQLDIFDIRDNRLECDCRMKWILNTKLPKEMGAVCETPAELHGKEVRNLEPNDVWCFLNPHRS